MFLLPAASPGQSLPSAVLMKTWLKPKLNQHPNEDRSWPRCVQAKRLRGSAGTQAKMGIRSKKRLPHCHGLHCPNLEEFCPVWAANATGTSSSSRKLLSGCYWWCPPQNSPQAGHVDGSGMLAVVQVLRVHYSHSYWLQRFWTQNSTTDILKASIKNLNCSTHLSAEIFEPCKPHYRNEWWDMW